MSVKKLLEELTDVGMTEKQLNILSAAIELFSEKGFAATSTSEIAKRAHVAEGTIFRHYKTKKDLLLSIPDYLSELSISKKFLQSIGQVLEEPNLKFEDFLRIIIKNREEFAAANMMIIKVMLQEISFDSELREKMVKRIFLPAKAKLVEVIDFFKEKGQILDIPTSTVVNLIITSVFGYVFTSNIAQLELGWDHEKGTDDLIRYIMHGICSRSDLL